MIDPYLSVPLTLVVAALWSVVSVSAIGIVFSSGANSRWLVAAMSVPLAVVVGWSAAERDFWVGQGPRWWFPLALVLPAAFLIFREHAEWTRLVAFTGATTVFFSMSGPLLGLDDLWIPTVIVLVALVIAKALMSRTGWQPLDFQRRMAVLTSVTGAVWVGLFVTQPIPN